MISFCLCIGNVILLDVTLLGQAEDDEPQTTVIQIGSGSTEIAGDPAPEYYFTDDPDDRFGF